MSPKTLGHAPAPTSRPRRRVVAAAMVLMALLVTACGGDDPASEQGTTTTAESPVAASALLTRLATEGSDAAFEAHFVGEVDTGGARSTYLYVGRGVDGAVAYVCDGDRGEWFTGSVDGDGAGELASRDGDATLTLTVVDGGLGAAVAGGTFDGAETVAVPLDDGEGQLVRLEASSENGGPEAAAGGIIVTPDGVRGVFDTSIADGRSNTLILAETPGERRPRVLAPTSTTGAVTDGQSNTIIVGEEPPTTTVVGGTPTDGQSNTIIVGEEPPTTTVVGGTPTDGQSNTIIVGEEPPTTTVVGGTPTDGQSNTIIVAESVTGALTLEVGAPTDPATTTTTAPADTSSVVACDAVTPLVDDLVLALETTRATTQHRLERVQQRRAELATRLETAADDQRPALEEQIARRDRRIARLTRQLDRIDEQIAALDGLVAPCRS
jgi:hypothetical protein